MNTIYIGPSNHKLGLIQFTIYTERPTALIDGYRAAIPSIDRLFVSVEEFSEVEGDLDKPETLIYAACKQVLQAGKEVKK